MSRHLLVLAVTFGFVSAHATPSFPFQVRVSSPTHFFDQPKACPNQGPCPWYRKAYLVEEDLVTVDRQEGDFSHVSYTSPKGKTTEAWVATGDLRVPGEPISDPSEHPDPSISDCEPGTEGWDTYVRMRADFNFDGQMDLAVSTQTCMFGNGGGPYTLYTGTEDGKYREVGTISGQVFSLSIGADGGGVIRAYSHSSSSEGGLSQWTLVGNDLHGEKTRMISSEEMETELAKDGAKILEDELGVVKDDLTTWKPKEAWHREEAAKAPRKRRKK